MLFSFVVLGFVAHLDDALSQIFVGPGTMRRCEEDLKTCFKAEKGMVKIHWLWNRAIAILLATLGTLSVLQAQLAILGLSLSVLRGCFSTCNSSVGASSRAPPCAFRARAPSKVLFVPVRSSR